MKTQCAWAVGAGLAAAIGALGAAPQPSAGYAVETVFANPRADEILASFDWGGDGALYYAAGRPNWEPGFSVYRHDGAATAALYADATAFVGWRVTVIGGRVYFNDGGTLTRTASAYFCYDPAQPAVAPTNLNLGSDVWGIETRNGTDVWAAGGRNAALYYSPLAADGSLEHNPLVKLGTVGGASGPLAFDAAGTLYYAEGYHVGGAVVYRWSAADVAAAIADPGGAPLRPAGHALLRLAAGDGATGLVLDGEGHPLVTATSFTAPSELQRLLMADGACIGYEVLARSDSRLETLRVRHGQVHVGAADGIYAVTARRPLRLAVQAVGGGAIGILGLQEGGQALRFSPVADGAAPWVVRGLDGNRMLVQVGDGGAIGVAEVNADNQVVRFALAATAAPGWIARGLDGNRMLVQAGDGGRVGILALGPGDVPAGFTEVAASAGGWIARDLDGRRILLQEGDGGAVGILQLDTQDRPLNLRLVSGPVPGWIVRHLAETLVLAQEGAGGMGGVMALRQDGAPAGWRLFLMPLGWTLLGLSLN